MIKDLTYGSPAKLIFYFTLPLILGNIFQQLYLLADTLLVGRILGVDALAAVGSGGSLMFLLLGFVIGFTTGLSIYTGQAFGKKNYEEIAKSVATCTILSVVATMILTIVGCYFVRDALILLDTPNNILDMATTFMFIIFLGVGASIMCNMEANLIRVLGDSTTPLYFLIAGCVLNIILEILFLYYLGFGIIGAASATVLAQLIIGLTLIFYIYKKIPTLHFSFKDLSLDKKILKDHLKIALPMGFQSAIIALGAIVLQVPLNNLGEEAIAAYAAAQKVDMIAVMPLMSFGMAMASFTAQNYGAKKYKRILQGVNKCIMMSLLYSVFIGFVNIFFGSHLIYIFVGAGEDTVVDYGHLYLLVNGLCYFILSLLFIFRYTLQGLGQSVAPTIAGFMELLMRSLAGLFLVGQFGFIGACWANPMAWIGSVIPLFITYLITRKSLKNKIAYMEKEA